MQTYEFHIFKNNTEAVSTNRGFYYQYLSTLKLWITNFNQGFDNEIYCEREDDIFEIDSQTSGHNFYQIKCYSEGISINSPQLKESLLNFLRLFIKHNKANEISFIFETNAFPKVNAGKSLKRWYQNQQEGNYSVIEFLEETRLALLSLLKKKLDSLLPKSPNPLTKDILKSEGEKVKNYINSEKFEIFLKKIKWKFSGEINTEEAVRKMVTSLKSEIRKMPIGKDVNSDLLFSYLLYFVIEKSATSIAKNRLLNNKLLIEILNDPNLIRRIAEIKKPELFALIQNNIVMATKIEEIKNVVERTEMILRQTQTASLESKDKEMSILDLHYTQLKRWFLALGYAIEQFEIKRANYFEFILNISHRRGFDRILVIGLLDVIEVTHLESLLKEVKTNNCDEGWIITSGRVGESARRKANKETFQNLFCYSFDDLIDQDTDFTGYFNWLENEIVTKQIDKYYIPLKGKKDVVDENTNKKVDSNEYYIENYIDQWLDDPSKKHMSVLGEFGTGKTWFTLHYAWQRLKEYRRTKEKGIKRSRVPIFIPLRDYSKAASIESLLSEFFFRKHKTPIRTYQAFIELNRMGKLLIIFDGFDEMADKIDSQKMVNNFWELAKMVTESSKIILTCRNEHFPEAKKGKELLSAELKASTQNLIIEAPQFEMLELLKLTNVQIKKLLGLYTNKFAIKRIFENKTLLDLARRPIMIELILGSLNEIESNKPIDIARIYLYAISKKLKKDIKEERTFTSIQDKLYFMCEISWEMLSTDNMSLNYRLFPDKIRNLFGKKIREEKDLDHWQYDMMGQTILTRNDEGDYKPAHRSFLEFFVAYKLAAELGVLDTDFTDLARKAPEDENSKQIAWAKYFQTHQENNLKSFKQSEFPEIINTFGHMVVTRAILDLLNDMISIPLNNTQKILLELLERCRYKSFTDVKYVATNLVIILTDTQPDKFSNGDLSNLCLKEYKRPYSAAQYSRRYFPEKRSLFWGTNFENCDLSKADLGFDLFEVQNTNNPITNLKGSNLEEYQFHSRQLDSIDISPKDDLIALGSPDEIIILSRSHLKIKFRFHSTGWDVQFSPDGNYFVHSGYGFFCVRNTKNFEIVFKHKLSEQFNPTAQENGKNMWTGGFIFSKDSKTLYVACNNAFVYKYDIATRQEISHYITFEGADDVDLSSDEKYLSCSEFNAFSIWEISTNKKVVYEQLNKTGRKGDRDLHKYYVKFHPKENVFALTDDKRLRLYDLNQNQFYFSYKIAGADRIAFSEDGSTLYIISNTKIFLFDWETKTIITTLEIKEALQKDSSNLFFSANDIVVKEINDFVYVIGSNQLLKFDIHTKMIMGRYLHLTDFTTFDFRDCTGISIDLALQIEKNGGLIKVE